jgi:hypothetical protein
MQDAIPLPTKSATPVPSGHERRRLRRAGVLKRAQVAAGNALHECLILDSSEAGVRIETNLPMALPDRVVLRLGDGQAITAKPVWICGRSVGLAFAEEERDLGPDTAARLLAIGEVLNEGQFDVAIRQIRAARFFEDPALRTATEEAEAARLRLSAALHQAALDAC